MYTHLPKGHSNKTSFQLERLESEGVIETG